MKHLFRTSALAALLLALTGLAFTPFEGASPEASKATHTLTIEYQQERGDFRRASLKIAPKEDGARAPWRGRLHSISVLTTDKRWIIIQSMEQSRGGNVQARAMLPGPGDISAIVLKPMRGPIVGWKVEEGEAYMEVEWTYFNQRGQQTDSPESDEPKEDPPSDGDDGDDGGDDGDDGDGDDDEGCSTAGCSGIIDPWTCECEDDIRDPWEDEVTNNGVGLRLLSVRARGLWRPEPRGPECCAPGLAVCQWSPRLSPDACTNTHILTRAYPCSDSLSFSLRVLP